MPSLPDLPLELVGLIGQGIDELDILTLRLVCRGLAAKTLDQVIARFFTEIQILVTRDNLQLLRDVSRHPVFRHSVHTLWILPCPFENRLEMDYEDYVDDCLDRELNFGNRTNEEAYQAYKASMEEYRALVTTDALHDTLRECIGSLPSLKRVLMHQEEGMIPKCRGWKKLCNSIGENPDDGLVKSIRHDDTTRVRAMVFVALLKALAVAKPAGIAGSEYSIDTLDARGDRKDGVHRYARPVSLDTSANWSPYASDACFSVLRKFRCQHMDIDMLLARHFDVHLVHALAEIFSKLQTLSLKYVKRSSPGFSPLYQAVRFTCLESLVLSDLEITADDLISFLRTAAPTLRRLHIQRAALALPRGGSFRFERHAEIEKIKTAWLQVFQFLKSNTKDLQSLHLGISEDNGIRLKNPLRGRTGDCILTPGLILDHYDAAVAEIGLTEWLDQLDFE